MMKLTVPKRKLPLCRITDCTNLAATISHKLCQKHYTRLLRHGDPEFSHRKWTKPRNNPELESTDERFHRFTLRVDGCLEWQGTRNARGYGKFGYEGTMLYAHRVAWELVMGPIPEGLQIMHWCDNPPCVWLPHLSVGTNKENLQQARERGRLLPLRGTDHPNAKLTWELADEIRTRWAGGISQRRMADEYGIHNSTINRIVNGTRWVR